MKTKKYFWIRVVVILMTLCFSITASAVGAWDGRTVAFAFAGGDGSRGNPYQINNANELALLAQLVNDHKTDSENGNKLYARLSYVLTADIDLSNMEWIPIGNRDYSSDALGSFEGYFNGRNHTVYGMSITEYSYNCGLFGETARGSKIENTIVEGMIRRDDAGGLDGNRNCGGLVGENGGIIDNCSSSAIVYNTYHNIGGSLVGENGASGYVVNSHASGRVTGGWDSRNGGLVGLNEGIISSCYAEGEVIQNKTEYRDSYNGGLVGDNWGGTILDSYATGMISSGGFRSSNGGLAGRNIGNCIGWHILSPNCSAVIQNCYSTATVTCNGVNGFNGGLVGHNQSNIANSYASGTVTGLGGFNGGLAGWNEFNIVNCYSLSTVVGTGGKNYNGGLVGLQYEAGKVSNCYFGGEITDDDTNSYSGGIAGLKEANSAIKYTYYLNNTGLQSIGAIDYNNAYQGGDSPTMFEGKSLGLMQSQTFTTQLNQNLENCYNTDITWKYLDGNMPGIQVQDNRRLTFLNRASKSDWFYDDAIYVMTNYVMDNVWTFPQEMKRCEVIATFSEFSRFDGREYHDSTFDDKFTGTYDYYYYSPIIAWGVDNGIVNGVGNNKFAPYNSVTREEFATMFVHYTKAMGIELPQTSQAIEFTDASQINDWAKDSVNAIVKAGIMKGKENNTFDPQGNVTKAEMAAIMHRLGEILYSIT